MSAVQVLRDAEALKSAAADTTKGSNEAWASRQALQDLYQKALVLDLEYALDKKVEQDLWNHAFKNQINVLQSQVKDKQNVKRGEVQASLNLFLETASGFYLQLLQELCSAFKLDLPFRRKPESLGILKEYVATESKMRMPKRASCMYISQHCLVHLGDIARYRQQADQAQTYYRHAARLVPYNGQPYNQLAILEAAKGNKLATVFYYVRSIAVKHQFPVASTNLEKFFTKISKDSFEFRGKLFLNELINSFLQFHALIYLGTDLPRARQLSARVSASLCSHISASLPLSSLQLLQIVSITLFAIRNAGLPGEPNSEQTDRINILLQFIALLLEALLISIPKCEMKAKDHHTLPALKTLLDWMKSKHDILTTKHFNNPTIWHNMSKLLNNVQIYMANSKQLDDLSKYKKIPLPEDCDVQCFLPIQSSHSELDFNLLTSEDFSIDVESTLRCQRLVQHGQWICKHAPSLLSAQPLPSGHIQFSVAHVKLLIGRKNSETASDKKSLQQDTATEASIQTQLTVQLTPSSSNEKVSDGRMVESHNTSPPHQEKPLIIDAPVHKDLCGVSSPNDSTKHDPLVDVTGSPRHSAMTSKTQRLATAPLMDHWQLTRMQAASPCDMLTQQMSAEQKTSLQSPQLLQQSPQLLRQSPKLLQQSPQLLQQSPQLLQQSPQLLRQSPQLLQQSPQLLQQSPQLLQQSPQLLQQSPQLLQQSPQLLQQSPQMLQQSPQMLQQSPQLLQPSPQLLQQSRSPAFQQKLIASPQQGVMHRPAMSSMAQSCGFASTPPPLLAQEQAALSTQLTGLSTHLISPHSAYMLLPNTSPPRSAYPYSSASSTAIGSPCSSPAPLFPSPPPTRPFSQSLPIPVPHNNDMYVSMPFGIRRAVGERGSIGQLPRHADFNVDELELQHQHITLTHVTSQSTSKPHPLDDSLYSHSGSLFSDAICAGDAEPATYSLFSESPWTVQINKSDVISHASSPFGSSNSSVRTTPDPFTTDDILVNTSKPTGLIGYNSANGSWPNNTPPTSTNSDNMSTLSSNIQCLWSSGPSPLEKLLEQQKQHRHGDPR